MFAPGDKHQLKLKMSISTTSRISCLFSKIQKEKLKSRLIWTNQILQPCCPLQNTRICHGGQNYKMNLLLVEPFLHQLVLKCAKSATFSGVEWQPSIFSSLPTCCETLESEICLLTILFVIYAISQPLLSDRCSEHRIKEASILFVHVIWL